MNPFLLKRLQNKQRTITEAEFLKREKQEQELEKIDNTHDEEDTN
jgi:hypothetical protein